ncbi:cation diffusion facilitator family transporter [Risungbinella massiliensis]|uniref:cation diffusion facilitator family transporter n=1 Tax=Risungbinella massiliensis TaxID=1329796 RepID=UPI0005CC060C|nr:cation diffusion facilitator family transporter [Risungbinella massiliensis]
MTAFGKRFDEAERVARIGIYANTGLAILKGVVGYWTGSRALIAEAANSASDVVGSFAVLFGLKIAKRPPDADHPYGYGKAETIAAIIVSVLIAIVGVEVASNAIQGLMEPIRKSPGWWAVGAAVVSVIVKEILFRYTIVLGKKLDSPAILANAWDHRSDVFSTLAAIIGIVGSIIGEWLQIGWLLHLDAWAGLGVALFVIYTAYRLAKENIHISLDHVWHEAEVAELLETVQSVDGVLHINDLRAREHGYYVIVDLKVAVDPHITVEEGHLIGKQVKSVLLSEHPQVTDVMVHINPYNPDDLVKD